MHSPPVAQSDPSFRSRQKTDSEKPVHCSCCRHQRCGTAACRSLCRFSAWRQIGHTAYLPYQTALQISCGATWCFTVLQQHSGHSRSPCLMAPRSSLSLPALQFFAAFLHRLLHLHTHTAYEIIGAYIHFRARSLVHFALEHHHRT